MSQAHVTKGCCTYTSLKHVYMCSIILVAVALAACLTHYLDEASLPAWEAVFRKNKYELTQFVMDVKSATHVADENGRFSVPRKLSKICCIERREAFLFFTLRSEWLDDSIQSLVFDLEDGRPSTRGVRALFTLLSDRPIYHIQYVQNGWYYCEFN